MVPLNTVRNLSKEASLREELSVCQKLHKLQLKENLEASFTMRVASEQSTSVWKAKVSETNLLMTSWEIFLSPMYGILPSLAMTGAVSIGEMKRTILKKSEETETVQRLGNELDVGERVPVSSLSKISKDEMLSEKMSSSESEPEVEFILREVSGRKEESSEEAN
jgi:hypothetical protein